MDSRIYILCVEDEPEVLNAVVKDLASIETTFPVETARSAEEARMVVNRLLAKGQRIGLILCDHVMPGDDGVDFLVELQKRSDTRAIRKVLLTGQAGLEPTVKAVNEADLKHYIAKPWKKEELLEVVKQQLTDFVIEAEKNLMPYLGVLDPMKIAEAIRRNKISER